MEPARIFHVADFGAVPGAPWDTGPALREAIAAATAHKGPAVVRLDTGVYRVAPAPGETTALPVRDADGLSIEGAGPDTVIMVTAPLVDAVRFHNCRNVGIARLAIDYDPLPFTQGTITSVSDDGHSFTMQCDPGYLTPGALPFAEAQAPWGMVVRALPDGGEQFGPIPVMGGVWSETADGAWQCTVPDAALLQNGGVRPSERYMFKARTMSTSGVAFWACVNVRLDEVTVHAAPSLASVWGLNENVEIRGLRVERPAGSGRLLSTNADGIHCLGNRGTLLIEGCSFEAMADDAINIHARASIILDQPAPDRLLVNEGGCVDHREGDRLQLYDPGEGRVRSESLVVTGVTRDHLGTHLTLNAQAENVVTGTSFKESDHLFNLDACGAGAVIRGNTFGSHRGRAVLLKTTDCLVEGNTFRNREGWGVTLHQLQGWGEGPAAQRKTIRGNTFEGVPPGYSPGIDIRPTIRSGAAANGMPVRDIRIENNRFINPTNGILSAWAVEGLEMVDNTVEAEPGTRAHRGPLMTLHTGTGLHIQNLRISDASGNTTAVVRVEASVGSGPEVLLVEGIQADMTPEVPVIEDLRHK